MPRATMTARRIAEHLGMDEAEVEAGRYQSTRYNKPVYVVGEDYWSAGAKPPVAFTIHDGITGWVRVTSSYDKSSTIWFAPGD